MGDLTISISTSATLNSIVGEADARVGATEPKASGEFERFEGLTRKLVQAPRPERGEAD